MGLRLLEILFTGFFLVLACIGIILPLGWHPDAAVFPIFLSVLMLIPSAMIAGKELAGWLRSSARARDHGGKPERQALEGRPDGSAGPAEAAGSIEPVGAAGTGGLGSASGGAGGDSVFRGLFWFIGFIAASMLFGIPVGLPLAALALLRF